MLAAHDDEPAAPTSSLATTNSVDRSQVNSVDTHPVAARR
jgi:hypothetical protein